MKSLQVGDKMPAFILKDQHSNSFNTADYIGKNKLVIYFYPKMKVQYAQKKLAPSETALQTWRMQEPL